MNQNKQYSNVFKTNIVRRENSLKTAKFHQMLHIVDYIIRYERPMNYDGCRGENFGKLKIKKNSNLPNTDKETKTMTLVAEYLSRILLNKSLQCISKIRNNGFQSIVMRRILYSIQTGNKVIYTLMYCVTYINHQGKNST